MKKREISCAYVFKSHSSVRSPIADVILNDSEGSATGEAQEMNEQYQSSERNLCVTDPSLHSG